MAVSVNGVFVLIRIGGNRQLNRLLHVIAHGTTSSNDHPGRIYYDRKRSEGKTGRSALRALKRTLATIVYYRLRLCQTRTENTIACCNDYGPC